MFRIYFVALALLLLLPAAFAQSIMGTLTGTVTDASGAVAPNANVTIRNEASGDLRKTASNAEGFFNFSSIPAGVYSLLVELQGFSRWERTGIVINANDKRNLTATLAVGAASTQVEVVAAADTLAVVDSGEKSALITSAQLENLSIVGRNATEFVKILPGAAMVGNNGENRAAYSGETVGINNSGMAGNQGGLGGVQINGSAADITSDGSHTADPGSNQATPVFANSDMIQELKVLTSNFAAENVKGPVVVNTVSKSGGNAFHGEGYLYARNPVLNANDWENNHAGLGKPRNEYYYPGANLGGPVIIPGTNFNKNRDKLFFFQGFEYYKQTLDSGLLRAFVPTPEMRQGDFSKANTYGPRVGGNLGQIPNYPGGIVPQTEIDPGGKVLLNLYPQPNADPMANDGFNYVNAMNATQNSYQSLTRIDYSVSDNTKLFVRYNRQRERQNQPTGLWGGKGSDWTVPNPTNIIGDNASDNIATSLTHVFTPTMTNELVFGYTFIDFPNYPEDPKKLRRADAGFPYQGVWHQTATLPMIQSFNSTIPTLGTYGNYNPAMQATKWLWNVGDNFAKVVGTHTLKFGAYFEQIINKQNEWNVSNGWLIYNDFYSASGNSYADILAGRHFMSYNENTVDPQNDLASKQLDFYAQDSWKASRRLTLEYGIRLQHIGAIYTRDGYGVALFDKSRYSNNPADLESQTGLYWAKKDKSAPLSGRDAKMFYYSPRFGFAYDTFGTGSTVLRGGIGWFHSNDGLQAYAGEASTGKGGRSWGCFFNCPEYIRDLDTMRPAGALGLSAVSAVDPNDHRMPLTVSYSFTINQRLPGSLMWESAYVGNHNTNGLIQYDLNALPLGRALGTGDTDQQHFRPYQNYQQINLRSHWAKSDYNSFQTGLSRQRGSYSLSANYTWAKLTGNRAITTGGNAVESGLADFGAKWRHGVLQNVRAHAFNVAYSIQLPKLVKTNVFGKAVLNNWEVSGISQVQSGADLPLNQKANFGIAGNGMELIGTNNVGLYPVMTCNPRSGLAKNQYINGACFGPAPGDGRLGDGAFPYLAGPIFMNHDISVFKVVPVSERKRFEFRASGYNFLNHPLWSFRQNDNNLLLQFDENGRQTNERFGYVDGKFGHRVLQLSLKFMF